MKYKRILAGAFALALTLPLLLPWAYAHPGRTDKNGGHTDSDTGDYHYHHGYEAHAHFDIDGNGTIDCPFDFDDQTGQNNGTSFGGAGGQSSNDAFSYSIDPHYEVSSFTTPDLVLETFPSFPTLPDYPIRSSRSNDDSGVPLILLLFVVSALFFFPWMYIIRNSTKSNTDVISPIAREPEPPPPSAPGQCSPLPPQTFSKPDPDVDFWPVLLPESEVSPHTRCRDTCRYLWYETLMIRSRVTPPPTSDACIYLWTALFYTAVKTLRSQASVDRIYSYFAVTTGEFVTEARYTDLVVDKVRTVYRQLREPLNLSQIDPRTVNGRRDLWLFLVEYSAEFQNRPDIETEFLSSSQRIWQLIADVFPQARPYPKAGDIRYSIDDLPED